MKVFKKSNDGRELRLAKTLSAKDAIGKIEKNSDTYILTFGQFSLIDALVVILDQIGTADVDISTWTAANAHLERTRTLLESAAIRKLRLVVDRSFETRQPEYCYHMRNVFGAECIRAIRTHAKFMVIRNDDWNIVVRTSMNLNENPRLENIEISENLSFAHFFTGIVDNIFSEVGEDINRSELLALEDFEENSPYKLVKSGQIERSNTHEPRTTHTVKK